mgnify:CR=1 FL=1
MPIDPRKDPHARIVVKPLPSQQAKGRDAAAGSGHLRPAASGAPFVRPANEDDDGYDPSSDRPPAREPPFPEAPWTSV